MEAGTVGRRGFEGLLLLISFAANGCLAQQVASDGRNFRQALQEMYVDQAMGNLIRAHENQPFVQLSYRGLTVTDTRKSKANVGNEYDPTRSKTVVAITGALVNRTRQFTDHLLFGASVETDRQMQFTADPVVNNTETYDYYRAFAHDPELFRVCDSEPDFPVYLKQKSGCRWYYIPCESKFVFQQLVLRTSIMLGQETPPPIFWSTRIKNVSQPVAKEVPGPKEDSGTAYLEQTIELETPVPNDPGATLYVKLNTCPESNLVIKLVDDANADPNRRTVTSVVTQVAKPLPDIKGLSAKFYSPREPNMGPQSWEAQRLQVALEVFLHNRSQAPPVGGDVEIR